MLRSLIALSCLTLVPCRAAAQEAAVARLTADIGKVDHAIRATKALIAESGDAVYLAELYVRLAELYVEKSRYAFARIAEQEGAELISGDTALEVRIVKEMAIDTYERVLRNFPDYEQRDRVRFFLAHEHRELGAWEAMLGELHTLIEEQPRSDWAIEARLIVADYHFDKEAIDVAERYYRAILELPESHLHDMARYKLGWVRINQRRFKEALDLFERAVGTPSGERRGAVGDARALDVEREALLAMAWPYSETRRAEDAPAYFRALARSKTSYVRVLRKLGDRYFIKTEFAKASAIYREVVRLSADVQRNIDYVQRIYESVRNMSRANPRRYAHAAADVDAIVETLARFENHPAAEREHTHQLERDLEVRARDLSTRLHLQARQTRSIVTARAAAEAYRKYLSLFDGTAEADQLRENRAEALFFARRFIDAGREYEAVARRAEDSGERRSAVYDAIVAYRRAIEQEAAHREKHPNSRLFDKLQLLRARAGLQQLGAYFIKEWPGHARVPEVKLNIARMHYQDGDFERAAELYAAFVREYPTHPDIADAAHLAMDSLRMLERYDELAAYGEALAASTAVADAALKRQAAEIAEQARDLKRRHDVVYLDPDEVRRRWLESEGPAAEGDLYTGFLAARTHRRIAEAFLFGERLVQRYPDSKHVTEVLETLAHLAQQSGDFDRGVALLEELVRMRPDHEGVAATAERIAKVRALLGDPERAAASLRLVRRIGSASQQRAAHRQLMALYRDLADWDTLARAARTAVDWDDGWAAGHANLGIAYAHQGKDTLAERHLARAASQTPSDDDRAIVARATFEYGQLFHRAFAQTHFEGAATAERVLAQKLELSAASERAYVATVGVGDGAWAIAGLREVARLYRQLAAFVVEAPLPPMPPSEAKAAQAALAERAAAWRTQAEQTLAACATKAEELRVLTPAASACAAGGEATVAGQLAPRRPDLSGNTEYQAELHRAYAALAEQPEDRERLHALARLAMRAGDFHHARLVLARAAELDPRQAVTQNLLGLAAWHLGDVDEAAAAFERVRQRHPAAALNLAALLEEYGYARSARRLLRAVDTRGVDLSAGDVHPRVRVMLHSQAGS